MKTLYDGVFINENKLLEEGIKYPIKIEYYKTIAEKENVKNKYGIEIIKTEYKNKNVNVETGKISNITNNLDEADKILKLLRDNEVTPVTMQDVLEDLRIGKS